MPQDGINIYMSLIDKVSSPLDGIGKKTKAFSKELQELEQKTEAYSKTQDKLTKETMDYRKKLEQANLTVQTAKKEFKKYKDEAHKGALDKAIEEQEEYKRKLRESEAAMKSNYKALGSMMDQQRKAGNQSGGDSLLGSLKNAGLFKMAGDALSQAAGAGLESALGQPTATAVSSILSGIASGAAMGAVTGTPHGVAAGALVGAGVGIVNAATAVGKASDGAFKSYVQEAAESQLAQRDSDITSGSSIAARRETDLISFSTLFKDRSVAKGYLEELVTIALSAARSGIGATAVGGYALFGGGELGSGNSAIVDAYDENLTRITLPNLSSARYGLAATSVGVYALFGGGSPSASSAIVDVYAA